MSQGKILTISIPTWNRAHLLEELLGQLVLQIKNDHLSDKIEIIISDNGSEDNTLQVIQKLMVNHNFVSYNNNKSNEGARANLLKVMGLAGAKYVLFLGDDDRLQPNALHRLIAVLENNQELGILIDTSKSKVKQSNPFSFIGLKELLKDYFWYMGNAGLFVIKSTYVRECLNQYTYEFFNPSWPQTQLQILGSANNPNDKIGISNLNLTSSSIHNEVMVYTSYYIWRTCYLDLFDSITALGGIINHEIIEAGKTYLKNNILQVFFNILQCGIFIDDKVTKNKTISSLILNLNRFQTKEKIYFILAIIALKCPVVLSRPFSNCFIYFLKGKSGINKKNLFVTSENRKKNKALAENFKSVRKFVFEN